MRVGEDGHITDQCGRLAAVQSSTSHHRAGFSEEDDQILLEWVTRVELQGVRTTSLKIFEDLARIVRRGLLFSLASMLTVRCRTRDTLLRRGKNIGRRNSATYHDRQFRPQPSAPPTAAAASKLHSARRLVRC